LQFQTPFFQQHQTVNHSHYSLRCAHGGFFRGDYITPQEVEKLRAQLVHKDVPYECQVPTKYTGQDVYYSLETGEAESMSHKDLIQTAYAKAKDSIHLLKFNVKDVRKMTKGETIAVGPFVEEKTPHKSVSRLETDSTFTLDDIIIRVKIKTMIIQERSNNKTMSSSNDTIFFTATKKGKPYKTSKQLQQALLKKIPREYSDIRTSEEIYDYIGPYREVSLFEDKTYPRLQMFWRNEGDKGELSLQKSETELVRSRYVIDRLKEELQSLKAEFAQGRSEMEKVKRKLLESEVELTRSRYVIDRLKEELQRSRRAITLPPRKFDSSWSIN